MSIIRNIISKLNAQADNHNYIGAESFRTRNPALGLFDCYASDEYASQFPNLRPIAAEYMSIVPKAIDANGAPVKHPALDALFHPNQKDSAVAFAEKVAVSTLSLPITYILVWRNEAGEAKPGGNFGFKGKNIAGYTFLERPAITLVDGKKIYSVGSQSFTELEVMELPGGVRADDLYAGYAPSISAARWSTLDSYIADFQKGFFENGAIPAGQFVITSSTLQDYKDTVEKLQDAHRGASKNNNVTYTPRPVDPASGKPAEAKIEWVPFQQSNKDIDFKPLLEHVNNRLSESYGVSSIIKGVDSAAKYSNAEVSENGFAKRAVRPLALRNYSQITHELNRITGGLGCAITFTYEIPAVSDAEKVKAETKQIEVAMIKELMADGFTLDSAVDALNLSPSYKLLKIGTGAATIDNDKPEVDLGNETAGSPDPNKIDGVTPLNKAAANSTNPKAKLSDQEKIEKAAKDFMESQVNRAISELKDDPVALEEPEQEEIDVFVAAMMIVITGILIANAKDEYEGAVLTAGLKLEDLQGFTFTTEADDAYRMYLNQVAQSYGNDTANSIRKTLLESAESGLNRRETEAKLRDILNTDDYRVKRLARTELNNSQNIGKLEGMKSLAAETNATWEKTINHIGKAACPLCQSQEGKWFPLEQPLWGLGEAINTFDDKGQQLIYVNDWQTNEASDYHANGRGVLTFRRVI